MDLTEAHARFPHLFRPLVSCSVLEYNLVGLIEEGKLQRMRHLAMKRQRRFWFFLVGTGLVGLLMIRCSPGNPAVTATPTKIRLVPALATNTPQPTPMLQLSATPTSSPSASPTSATVTPSPSVPAATAVPMDTQPVASPTQTPLPPTSTATLPATAPSPSPQPPTATASSQPPLPPQQGGEWDMEAGFVPGVSPWAKIARDGQSPLVGRPFWRRVHRHPRV